MPLVLLSQIIIVMYYDSYMILCLTIFLLLPIRARVPDNVSVSFIIIIYCFLTFPADGAVALDDPECLFQLVAVSEQVKQTLSVVGTVAQVYGHIDGRYTSLAVRRLEPVYRHLYGTFVTRFLR